MEIEHGEYVLKGTPQEVFEFISFNKKTSKKYIEKEILDIEKKIKKSDKRPYNKKLPNGRKKNQNKYDTAAYLVSKGERLGKAIEKAGISKCGSSYRILKNVLTKKNIPFTTQIRMKTKRYDNSNMLSAWSAEDSKKLRVLRSEGMPWKKVGEKLGRSDNACRVRFAVMKKEMSI